ncbi:protein ALP1-like [Trichonephila inaurata madagascariensis]|uniref:Protein ALP1-like n=1 Tax=Trichonephila inaurata madagascariensis TaxID=2747483 RepID=A0A8X6WQK1_9ARAC|nr:protein ALP1-like [Trichonephila inaurata madagascariensis]
MASDDQVILALGFAAICDIEIMKAKKRKIWQRKWLQRRTQLECYENLMKELALEDSESYRRFLRMDVSTFEELVALVSPSIERNNTSMREAIPAAERIASIYITQLLQCIKNILLFISSETQSSLSYQFRIAQNTISGIIPAVCSAIYHHLGSEIQVPESENEWKMVAEEFWAKWNFPLCLGAMDRKHIRIKPPPHSGATYRNYKGFFSIVLLAVVVANLKFLYVDVGTNGRVSDRGVWGKSKLRQAITNGDMNIPEAAALPGLASNLPFVIVADDAFPLMPNIMKPYPGSNLSKECLIFNYRLSRARRVSKNAFGILAARFRVFGTTILTSVPNTKLIVLAACSLHNFLTNRSKNTYIPEDSADREDILNGVLIEGNWRQNTNQLISCQRISSRGSNYAKDVRDRFCNFFNAEGAVPWQDNNYTLH